MYQSNLSHSNGTQDPQSIAFDHAGNLYVGCRNNGNPHVAKFDRQLQFQQYIGQGQFSQGCTDMAFDTNENLYVVTTGSIKKFAHDGTFLGTISQAGLSPMGMAIDDAGVLWVTNNSALSVYRFNSSGAYLNTVPVSFGAFPPSGLKLFGIAFDARASQDCNSNGTPDACDIAAGTAQDCNGDGTPDSCQLAGHDCNSNGILDACEPDCNANGIPNDCEIASGAPDCNSNGIPDSCEGAALDQALQFDGGNDYLNAGNPAILDISNGITLEAWVRPDFISGYHVIVSKGAGGVSGYGFITYQGKLDFVAYNIKDYFTTGTYLTPDIWKHVAVVVDTTNNAHYYVNGQPVETVNGTSAPTVSPNPLLIGRTSLTGAEYWAGALDEVRIWSVMRTAQQIADTYNTHLSGLETGLIDFGDLTGNGHRPFLLTRHQRRLRLEPQADGSDPTWVTSAALFPPIEQQRRFGFMRHRIWDKQRLQHKQHP